jgi:UDP-glucose 4-epimerase
MNSVLVVGASGFLGSRFVQHCILRNLNIKIASSNEFFSSKFAKERFAGNFNGLSDEETSEVLNGIDVVLDASGFNAKQCEKEPHKALYYNSYLPSRLAMLSKKAGVKHFIYLSSVHVYGNSNKTVITENSYCLPSTIYGQSKLAGEFGVVASNEDGKFRTTVLRLSNVFGVSAYSNNENLILFVSSLCKQIVSSGVGEVINPYVKRDFIPASTVMKVFERLCFKREKLPKENIVNICSGESWSCKEMAEKISAIATSMNILNELKFNIVQMHKVQQLRFKSAVDWCSEFNFLESYDEEIRDILNNLTK